MSPTRRTWQSFGLALTLESLLVAGGLLALLYSSHKVAASATSLVIELQAPTNAPMPAPMPAPPTTPPSKLALPVPTPKALPKEPQKQEPPLPVTPSPAAVLAPTPAPVPAVAPPQATAAVASKPAQASTHADVDALAAYNAKLAAAVQAAFEMPLAAQELAFKGRTRVEFVLRDGHVSSPRVVQPSGLGAADRAAIKAVQSATYPPPPESLKGKEGLYQIWVACL
jgi:periplasmic protein TonB